MWQAIVKSTEGMELRKKLQQIIAQAAGAVAEEIGLEHPELEQHGDYSSNIALALKGGRKLAEEIVGKIKTDDLVKKIEVAGPGFINMWLNKKYLVGQLGDIRTESELKGKKIMVEFTDPNPFKEFHIGHLYSNVVGESLARLFEAQGAEVWRVCYQGDVGLHVAKSVWGMQKLNWEMPTEAATLSDKAKFLGRAYALGANEFEGDEKIKAEINDINKRVYEKSPDVWKIYSVGRKWSLDYLETIYKRLGTKFKRYYFESEAGQVGLEYVRQNLGKVFEQSEGAIVFKGEKYGLHTRVFVTSQGLPAYEAKELGLAPTKYKDFTYDLSIIVTGNEISEYFRVLLKALSLINPELAQKTLHISHGMVRLPSGKMSSRTGQVITGEDLMDEAREAAAKLATDNLETDKVGLAAIKYALLRSGIGHDVEFDFKESVSFSGNSGPYLQYTYARIVSVLRKSGRVEELKSLSNYQFSDAELGILRYSYRFGEVVEEAAKRYAPNLVCNYLYELAQRFNSFYNADPILGNEFRLILTKATGKVLKKGLNLLGIEVLERM